MDDLSSSRSFWNSPTLDDHAKAQRVRPLVDVERLFGTWPGDPDDGFEEAISELRHGFTSIGKCDD